MILLGTVSARGNAVPPIPFGARTGLDTNRYALGSYSVSVIFVEDSENRWSVAGRTIDYHRDQIQICRQDGRTGWDIVCNVESKQCAAMREVARKSNRSYQDIRTATHVGIRPELINVVSATVEKVITSPTATWQVKTNITITGNDNRMFFLSKASMRRIRYLHLSCAA